MHVYSCVVGWVMCECVCLCVRGLVSFSLCVDVNVFVLGLCVFVSLRVCGFVP